MRTHPLLAALFLLLLLLLTGCTVRSSAPDPLQATHLPCSTLLERGFACQGEPPSSPAWAAIDHPEGEAWQWEEDPTLLAVLVSPDEQGPSGWTPGLYLLHGDQVLGFEGWREWLGDTGWMPVLLVFPRSDGTDAWEEDGALHLGLAGSAEHGCPSDALEAVIRPRLHQEGVELVVELRGVPYLALPDAPVEVRDHGEWRQVDPEELAEEGSVELSGFSALVQEEGPTGELRLLAGSEVPWLQLQHHDGFIEVDFDHGCEVEGFTGATLALVTEL